MKNLIPILLVMLLFTGCATFSKSQPSIATVTTVTDAGTIALATRVNSPEPETALNKIYEAVKISDVKEADLRDLSKVFAMDTKLIEESYIRYTSGKYGIANVFILKPKKPDDTIKLRDQLEQVKLAISRETEHYDIYNAYQISQDTQIFEQGDYVVMLMLSDMEAARKIIDTYIPKK